jgi:tetratricopeptide (TPR) repeat protein
VLAKAPPSDAERIWQLAALALCEGARDVVTIDAHLTRMQRRFPGEPRILLGRAFITEVQFWDDDWAYWGKADGARAARPLQAAMASAANRDEALLRLAYFMLYAGRPTEAIDALKQISSSTDEGAAYLAGLFEGWADERLGRPYDAIRAFRAALAVAPQARAATLHLAVMLAAAGGREEADRVIGAVLDGRVETAPDPWTIYGCGDLRRFPLLVGQLRRSFE